jgi:hypothetical protein
MNEPNASNVTCLERRCRAKSSRTGQPCRRWAILGGNVCPTHGGSIHRVKLSAQQRLAEMVDPALTSLADLVIRADNDAIKLAAIKDVLDRAGFKPRERVETSGKVVIEIVYADAVDGPHILEMPALGAAVDQEEIS